jgi:hypothetical protein
MPDASIRVIVAGQRPGERGVGPLSPAERRGFTQRGAHQRMPEADHAGAGCDQPGALGRIERVGRELEPGGRA